jgi:DNA-binding FrmR family transcriptional regulator
MGALAVEDWTPDQVRGDAVRVKAWGRAVERMARAEAQIAALAHSEDEDAYDRAVDRQIAALGRVLEAAAPDLLAVGAKIGLIARHQAWELGFGEAAFGVLEADVRRLSRGG